MPLSAMTSDPLRRALEVVGDQQSRRPGTVLPRSGPSRRVRRLLHGVTGVGAYAVEARHLPTEWAGLLSAVVGPAGAPGSVYGGLVTDRRQPTRAVVTVPPSVMAVGLAPIPGEPPALLGVIAFLSGALEVVGHAARASVPSRAARVRPEHVRTAIGLMPVIAVVGGLTLPSVFGWMLGPDCCRATGWVFLGAAAALVGFAGRDTAPTLVIVTPSASEGEPDLTAAHLA